MANRFTAPEKWNDPWFCGLSPVLKLFWIYLTDNCNIAGIWNVNWPLVKFHIWEENIDASLFGERVQVISESKWFLPKFVMYQQKVNSLLELNPSNNCHLGIIRILQKEGILGASEGLTSPIGKGKVEVKVKEGVVRGNKADYDLSWPISYLNQLLGTRYTTKGANADFVKARYSEGRTQNDFKTVIDKKVAQWQSDEKMSKYLRPETLFNRTKFESYLNELTKTQEASNFYPKHPKSCPECWGNGYTTSPGSGLKTACREKILIK